MEDTNVVGMLVARARRRYVGNLICEQATVGTAAALGGALVLLLVGTQILDWYWLVMLFAAGAGISAWRTLRGLPSNYLIAQQVDHRLGLYDALSTALHFAHTERKPGTPALMAEAQRRQAEEVASTIDAAQAMPWHLPRQAMPAGALAAAVLVMFGLRYTVNGSLDLRQPLVSAVADFFRSKDELAARQGKNQRPGEIPLELASEAQEPNSTAGENEPGETPGETSMEAKASMAQEAPGTIPLQAPATGDKLSEPPKQDEPGRGGQGASKGDSQSKQDSGNDAGQKADKPSGQSGGSGEQHAGLMDKMRDAMANLMSKLKPTPGRSGEQAQASAGKGDDPNQSNASPGDKANSESGSPSGQATPMSDPNAKSQGESQQAASGQGSSDQKGGGKADLPEGSSSAGKDDGSKALKDAEQLAAMGKLSEIFGKRAQNVTGEMMVEVTGSKQQQLRTAYSQRGNQHSDSGGEIHRDEIPLEFQQYVLKYFETVRKGESTGAPAAPKKK